MQLAQESVYKLTQREAVPSNADGARRSVRKPHLVRNPFTLRCRLQIESRLVHREDDQGSCCQLIHVVAFNNAHFHDRTSRVRILTCSQILPMRSLTIDMVAQTLFQPFYIVQRAGSATSCPLRNIIEMTGSGSGLRQT